MPITRMNHAVMWLAPAEHRGTAEQLAIVDPLDLDAARAHVATVGRR
jgi:hypothetical protein